MGNSRLLTFEEEQDLFRKYKENNDPEAREEIICCNINLVKSVAKNYLADGVEYDDIVSEGCIGLMKAVEKFDYKRGYKFSTYAHWWIKQAIMRYISDNNRTIRLPAHAYEKYMKIIRFTDEYEKQFGSKPANSEIAAAVGMNEESVRYYLMASVRPCSLQSPAGEDGEAELGDFIECDDPTPDTVCELEDRNILLIKAVNTALTTREKNIIEKRFGLNGSKRMTLLELGESVGLTKERVRQIELGALRKLKRHLEARELYDGNAA